MQKTRDEIFDSIMQGLNEAIQDVKNKNLPRRRYIRAEKIKGAAAHETLVM